MSNSDKMVLYRQNTFKQFDVGQAVILNDAYLAENQHELQLQARVAKIIQDAKDQAQQIVNDAQQQAQQIIQTAEEKAAKVVEEEGYQQRDSILNQGYQEGYEAGLENGIQEISRRIADKIQMGERMLEEALAAQEQILTAQSDQILSLLDYLLKQILAHEISTSPDQLGALILQAVAQLHASGAAKIVMNPQMLQSMKNMSPELQDMLSAESRLHFVPDNRCPMDHIYLETVDYCYNISPQAQADVLLKAVATYLPSNTAHHDYEDPMVFEQNPPQDPVETSDSDAIPVLPQPAETIDLDEPLKTDALEYNPMATEEQEDLSSLVEEA